MTIQVGHPHKCPTFFLCAFPGGSQRVNELVSDRSYKLDSAEAAKCKSPFLLFLPNICAICDIYQS